MPNWFRLFQKPNTPSSQPKNNSSSNNNNNNNNNNGKNTNNSDDERFIESQVQESLQNLRNAETLVNRAIDENMKQQAMQIYQSSISVLIQVMNTKQSLPKNLTKDVLAQQVHKALTQAEHLKQSLSPKRSNRTQQQYGSYNAPKQLSPSTKPTSPSNNTVSNRSPQTSIPTSNNKNSMTQSPHLQNPLYPLISETIHIPSNALPQTPLSSLSGLALQKQTIQTSLLQPLQHPHLYTGLRTPPSGILLYGPPGTGKTMLVKAIAYESSPHTMFFSCSSATLSSKWHGEGEKIIWLLFQIARDVAPSLIFLDEMDSLLGRRGGGGSNGGNGGNAGSNGGSEHDASRRFKTEFMVQMDGILSTSSENPQKRLWVIGCTNTPWDLDEAILRRMEVRLFVPLPDAGARTSMIQSLLQQNSHSLRKAQIQSLVDKTKGYSCSDLRGLGREAAFGPLRDLDLKVTSKRKQKQGDSVEVSELRPISFRDFEYALGVSARSVSQGLLQRYQRWEQEQGGSLGQL